MHFHTLRQKPFTSALTTTGKRGASTFGAHARTKTMLLFPGSLGSL
jgi:hypothetical protein